MKPSEIMAIVVSHNPSDSIVTMVNILLKQVGHILIVDNKSTGSSIGYMDSLSGLSNLTIKKLDSNVGIGAALNVGVRYAEELGFTWVLTMDQDSLPSENMILEFSRESDNDPNILCLSPLIYGTSIKAFKVAGEVNYSITSGNLVKTSLINSVGGYDEDLFIDGVDFDFSLKVLNSGYKIFRVNGAFMQHELGSTRRKKILLDGFYTCHSPIRRYYIFRNYAFLIDKYLKINTMFSLKLLLLLFLNLITITLYGPLRLKSYFFMIYGVFDFIRGKRGIYCA
jgi:rhamnosyltransferase